MAVLAKRRQSMHLSSNCNVVRDHLRYRGHAWPLYETDLLRNGSELLAVMVRASWAIGEDTGFVLPSWSILVGSWFLRVSSCEQQSTKPMSNTINHPTSKLRCVKTCQNCLTPYCSAVTALNVKLSVYTSNSVLFISPHTWCQITCGAIHHSWRQLFSTHAVSDKAKEMKSCWFFFFPSSLLFALPSHDVLERKGEMAWVASRFWALIKLFKRS